MNKLKIVVIGAGWHAQKIHYPILNYIDEVNLAAACDLDNNKLVEVQQKFNISHIYTDYQQMIEKEKPDGVVIVMPPMLLLEVTINCLKMGCNNIMIEKPPGCTSIQTQQIIDVAKKNNCKVMVSLNRRFMPIIGELKKMVKERGGPIYCLATYNKLLNSWNWQSYLAVADAIHLIDLFRVICGEPNTIYGFSHKYGDYINSNSSIILFDSGATATINTHYCVGGRMQLFEIHSKGLSAYLNLNDSSNPKCKLLIDNAEVVPPFSSYQVPKNIGIDSYLETLHFIKWIQGKEKAKSAIEDVIFSMYLCEAIAIGYKGKMKDFIQISTKGINNDKNF